MKKIYLLSAICWMQVLPLPAQDTVLKQLPAVPIDAFRPRLVLKPDAFRIDSSFLAQFSSGNLTEALVYDGAIALKQYGPGALASTSFRGASSYQTPILWNGFNIQNPMYGQPDLSLFPVAAMDELKIEYGAGTTQTGSGAVSGAVVMNNTTHFNEGLNVGINSFSGSFGTYNNLVYGRYGNEKLSVSAKAYYNRSENNFPFNNTAQYGAPRMEQPHASLYNYGSVLGVGLKPRSNQLLLLNAWYQYSDRNLPPLMTQARSAASQQDGDLKASAEWKLFWGSRHLAVRTGFFRDRLHYNDSLSNLYSRSHAIASISEISYWWAKHRYSVELGLNATYYDAKATSQSAVPEGYPEGRQQFRSSLFGIYKNRFTKWLLLEASLRKELVDDRLISPAIVINGNRKYYDAVPEGALKLDLFLRRWLQLKLNASTLYRLPTLNDLYWNPGGNPDLRPEEGLSEEATLSAFYDKPGHFYASYDVTYFNRNVNNWIIWLPGPSYWSPENVLKVWSRGFEHRVMLSYSAGKFTAKLSVNYTYTLSTNERTKSPNDASLHEQLIYCPVHQAALRLYIAYAKWYVSYLQSYTGYRYTSSDNLDYLPDYSIAKAGIGYNFSFKKISGAIGLSCSNVFDIAYQSVLWQAMPGRSYGVDVKLNFGQRSTKTANNE